MPKDPNFSGVIAPVLTPYGEDGGPDAERFVEHCQRLMAEGCTGLAPFGTTSEGNKCVACHMPQIATTIADVNVRSHTFNFISPSMTDKYKIPNPCTSCHKDRSPEWATEALKKWPSVSPWRTAG